MRKLTGIAFLLLQAGLVVNGQFRSDRWYCWAPNDYAVWYRIEVQVVGVTLTPGEIEQRYQIPAEHVAQHPAINNIEMIRQYETTYGRNDHAEVQMFYRRSGGDLQRWSWPPLR